MRLLDAAQVAVDDVGVRSSTLDDVFFSLTGRAAEEEAEEDADEPGERAERSA